MLEQAAATTTTTYATKVYRINIVFAMLKTFSSICLLTLILISLVSTTSILLQQHYAAAEELFQKRYPHVTFVHANTNDILANNNNNINDQYKTTKFHSFKDNTKRTSCG